MGTASSKDDYVVSNTSEIAVRRRQMIEMIERFVVNVYASCPRIEAMWLILSSKLGQKAFASFVKAETADEYLSLFLAISEVLAQHTVSYDSAIESLRTIKSQLFNTESDISMSIPDLLRNELLLEPEADAENTPDQLAKDIFRLLERLQNEVVFLMARDLFNRFILSKYYKTWRAAEASHAIATTFEDAATLVSEYTKQNSVSLRNSSGRSASMKMRFKMKGVVQPADLSTTAFYCMDHDEISEILKCRDSWLSTLLAAVEALPICFSLASANPARRGFPLIYVNRYFEKITGYGRDEILGRNCREFLQCPETEVGKCAVLSEGLKSMVASMAVLTNKMQDGRKFKNLVALKPIMDDKKRYCYVVGLHFDVTREVDHAASKFSLAQELLEMIPDYLFSEEESVEEPKGCMIS